MQKPLAVPPRAPLAERRPQHRIVHGTTLTDDYAWLRADNWQEVLRNPGRLPTDIRALLTAENTYAEATLAPTNELRARLVKEMRGRIKEDDSGVPTPDGPFRILLALSRRRPARIDLSGATRRRNGRIAPRRRCRVPRQALFRARPDTTLPRPPKARLERGRKRLRILWRARANTQIRKRSSRPPRRDDRQHRLERRFARALLRAQRCQPSPQPRVSAPARHRAER